MQDWIPEVIPTPIFSLAERDRRWSRAREAMIRENLDGLLAPATLEEGDTLYLTQVGGRTKEAWIVFARDPAKPIEALVESNRVKSFWLSAQSWLGEENFRVASENISESVVLAIKELGLERGRIGVAQLTGIRFDPEGLIPFTTFDRIRSALPQASLVATDLLHRLRMIKSEEEIDVIKQIVAANERAIVTLVESARTATKQADIWYPVYIQLLLATGELPTRLSMALDRGGNSTLGTPTGDRVEEGQILSEEIAANHQGYRAQINQSLFIGSAATPGFAYYKTAMDAAIKIFFGVVAAIRPGKMTTGELMARYMELAKDVGAEPPGGVLLHSSGMGSQRPRVGPTSKEDMDIVLQPGMTFDLKPTIAMRREVVQDVRPKNRSVQIGEHVVVTESGAVRLGQRELKAIATKSQGSTHHEGKEL
jgi:Xaa-Pro aminopeptidase